jgi:hypothetical protein
MSTAAMPEPGTTSDNAACQRILEDFVVSNVDL